MCLYIKHYELQTADKDIVCWKVLEIIEANDGEKIVTPFVFCPLTEDELNGKKLFKPDKRDADSLATWLKMYEEEIKPHHYNSVEEGVIHTYGAKYFTVKDLYDEMNYHINGIGSDEIYIDTQQSETIGCDMNPMILGIALYKCVIPKGTEYIAGTYIGHSGSHLISYGSKGIRFVEKAAEWRKRDGYDTGGICLQDKVRTLVKEMLQEDQEALPLL